MAVDCKNLEEGKGKGLKKKRMNGFSVHCFFFPSKIDFEEMGFQVSLNGVEITR